MTGATLSRRPGENAMHVARFAFHIAVRAQQRKSGSVMIEPESGIRVGLGICVRRRKEDHQDAKKESLHRSKVKLDAPDVCVVI